jgi:hypothetical protein
VGTEKHRQVDEGRRKWEEHKKAYEKRAPRFAEDLTGDSHWDTFRQDIVRGKRPLPSVMDQLTMLALPWKDQVKKIVADFDPYQWTKDTVPEQRVLYDYVKFALVHWYSITGVGQKQMSYIAKKLHERSVGRDPSTVVESSVYY